MVSLIALIILTAATGFICTLVETTLLNITPTYLRQLKQFDPELAHELQLIHANPEITQSALAGVNTLLIVFGSALTGVKVADVYGSTAVPMAAFLTAFAMVGLVQVLPRAIAHQYWQRLCKFSLAVLPAFKLFSAPFTLMATIVKKLGLGKNHELVVRSEIETVTEQGFKDGALEAEEYHLLNNVLQFKQWRLKDIMIPRHKLTALDPDDTIESALTLIEVADNNKFPLFGRIHNETAGYVSRADLAQAVLQGKGSRPVRELARTILTVPHDMRARKLLAKFRSRNCEIALIVDDYAEVIGMVAQEDVLNMLFENIERRVA